MQQEITHSLSLRLWLGTAQDYSVIPETSACNFAGKLSCCNTNSTNRDFKALFHFPYSEPDIVRSFRLAFRCNAFAFRVRNHSVHIYWSDFSDGTNAIWDPVCWSMSVFGGDVWYIRHQELPDADHGWQPCIMGPCECRNGSQVSVGVICRRVPNSVEWLRIEICPLF
jgi:hypothetical protein